MFKMKKILIIIMLVICLFLSSCNKKTTVVNNVINQTVDIEDTVKIETLEDAICNTVLNVEQSVVGIKAYNDNTLLKTESFGSGVIISKNDNKYYIITNRHVILKQGKVYNNIKIYLGNLDLYIDGKVLTYDEKVDLAVVEVETDILLKPCILGNITDLKKGKFCIAVGSPYELEVYYNTITVGNISSIKRVINESNYFYKEISNEYIQTTATINEGCSGGGLFNLKGELIGINTWKLVDSSTNIDGMNFAVGVDKIQELFSQYLH